MGIDKIRSYAKINLALNVIRKNKFLHKIESIVAFIALYDEISIKLSKSHKNKILFIGKFSKNIKKENTVSKLLNLLKKKKLLKNKKFEIIIKKYIPEKAGLGGGSMNAATILKYFIKKKIINLTKKEIVLISKSVGSDVILGLNPTYSILNSKNEIKYFRNCKSLYTLIVKPNFGCSTKSIFSGVKKFQRAKFDIPKRTMFNLDYLKKQRNSLEPIVMSKYSKLREIKSFLENFTKPVFVRMTGSGSSLVAYFRSKERCDNAKKRFNKKYKNYWCISSKTI